MPTPAPAPDARALTLIAAEAAGYPEHLLVALGFSIECLASLVRSGLAGVTIEHAGSRPAADTVFRLWVTKRGMEALQAPAAL